MSRGIESIPAVWVVGSTLNRIRVSVQKGQSPLIGSPPRKPTNRMLMRLAPSQVGYSLSSETCGSDVMVAAGVFGSLTLNGVAKGLTDPPVHRAGGIPASEV